MKRFLYNRSLTFILKILLIIYLFLKITNVLAVDYSYSSSTYDTSFSNCGFNGTLCEVPGAWNGQKNLGVRQDNPGGAIGPIYRQDRYSFRIYGGTTYQYKANNTYLIQITFSTTDDYFNNLRNRYNVPTIIGNTTSSATGASDELIGSYTYSLTRVDGYTNRYLLSVSVVPSSDVRFIGIYYYANELTSNFISTYSPGGNVTYNALKITYSEGTNAVIQQQTQIMIQNFNNLFKILSESSSKTDDIIQDDTPPSPDETNNFVNDSVGWLPPGPVDSILNLPLNFLNGYVSALGNTCSPVNLPLPYVDKNLPLPCLSSVYSQIDGFNTFWNWVGALTGGYILIRYFLGFYVWVDKTLTFQENNHPGYFDEP